MSKKLVSILSLSLMFSACSAFEPKYKAGDCVESDPMSYCEKWEPCHATVDKILEVGVKHYHVAFIATNIPQIGVMYETFTIDGTDYKSHKVECPAALKDVK